MGEKHDDDLAGSGCNFIILAVEFDGGANVDLARRSQREVKIQQG